MMDNETTRLRALLKGIALPWRAQPTVVDGDEVECLALVLCPHGDDGDTTTVAEIDMGDGVECDDAHAALIAAAVNALPGLLDRVERAERELATATASVRQLRADVELATAQRDAEACRADNAERERADLAATLETRTAEHALAMEQLAAVTAERDRLTLAGAAPGLITGIVRKILGAVDGEATPTAAERVVRERDVLRAQQAPLLDAHDALVAAARVAGWTGAGATGAELVAWVRRGEREACADAITARLAEAVREVREKTYRGTGAERDTAAAVRDAIEAVRDMIREGGE